MVFHCAAFVANMCKRLVCVLDGKLVLKLAAATAQQTLDSPSDWGFFYRACHQNGAFGKVERNFFLSAFFFFGGTGVLNGHGFSGLMIVLLSRMIRSSLS